MPARYSLVEHLSAILDSLFELSLIVDFSSYLYLVILTTFISYRPLSTKKYYVPMELYQHSLHCSVLQLEMFS